MPTFSVHVVRFSGRVAYSEIDALANVHAEKLDWAAADTFHIIADGADLSRLTTAQLDAVRARYRSIHGRIEFFILRR
jgi:hypothetical protein